MKGPSFPPLLWLATIVVVVLATLSATGRLEPRAQPDTRSYQDVDLRSLRAALAQPRTLGYPLFLALAELVSDDERAVPLLQWLAHVLATGVFFAGLRTAGLSSTVAAWAAAPLLISRSVWQFVPQLTGDSLAIACAIASAGSFLALCSSRRAILPAVGLIVFTLAAYHVRPAYLFLVPLWPCLALLFDTLVFRRDASLGQHVRKTAFVLGCTALPLLVFFSVRGLVVGHFGLVSFGGYNIVGIAGQILEPSTIGAGASEELQSLARAIIQRREQLPGYRPPADFLAMEAQYNDVVWKVALPAAEQQFGADRVAVNQALTQLSRHVIREHPAAYARWLVWNAKHALKQIHLLMLLDPGSAAVIALFLLMSFVRLVRGPQAAPAEEIGETNAATGFREMHLLLWTALAFAAAKTALVILVEPAIDRYMTGAMTFMPSALAVVCRRIR